jgi:hypothetical protein
MSNHRLAYKTLPLTTVVFAYAVAIRSALVRAWRTRCPRDILTSAMTRNLLVVRSGRPAATFPFNCLNARRIPQQRCQASTCRFRKLRLEPRWSHAKHLRSSHTTEVFLKVVDVESFWRDRLRPPCNHPASVFIESPTLA